VITPPTTPHSTPPTTPGTTRRTADLHGILVAVSTPFTADAAAVDEETLRAQTDRLIGAGVHGLVATGTTGEFPTLTDAEYRRVIEAYVQAADHRVPVVAGVGALSTRAAVDLARHAEAVGADAVMLVPPFYGGVGWDTLVAFLSAVAEAISIPIVYYNVPSATGTLLTASQLADLGGIPGLDYLKDTSGDAVSLSELLVAHPDRITAFNGWDTLTFFGIAAGARGSVWGAAGIVPELAVQLWDTLAVKGDLAAAREQWKHLWAISDFLESVDYVAGVKAGLDIVGHSAGPARLPVQPLPGHEIERFTRILTAAGQVPAR
jgi:dihydrodipicolinate synthase/N-acetylneuraminate lyase